MISEFLHYEIVTQPGNIVEVALTGNAANVFLLDDINFQSYQSRKPFQYFGGFFNHSPAVLRPPRPGRWHLVVDLGGAQAM